MATRKASVRKTEKPEAVSSADGASMDARASKATVKVAKPRSPKAPTQDTGEVLKQLKALAKDLNQAAKDLGKGRESNPKAVSTILNNVERMTAEAATTSLIEAESAKIVVGRLTETLGKDWSRREIDAALTEIGGHLTNIMVAQEFQDLAGQSIRQAMKALVGAIIVTESGGPTEDGRLSQNEVDSLLKDLMP